MPLKYLIFFIILISSTKSHCQLFDSIYTSLQHKPRLDVRLDSRHSFITARKAKIFGFKIGFDFNHSVKLGLGYNALSTGFEKERTVKDLNGEIRIVPARLRFFYLSPYFEYVFHRTKRWEHSIPVQIGFGNAWYEFTTPGGLRIRENYKPIILYEPSMTAQYKIFKWLGVGVGVGYRLILINNSSFEDNFNSPIYIFRLKIYTGAIYRSVFPKKV